MTHKLPSNMPRKALVSEVDFKVSIIGAKKTSRLTKKPQNSAWWIPKTSPWCPGRFETRFESHEPTAGLLYISYHPESGWDGYKVWRVRVFQESCNYGGGRLYFLCPITRKRCSDIYIHEGQLGSRAGLRLGYDSQLENSTHRAYKWALGLTVPRLRRINHRERILDYRNGKKTKLWERDVRFLRNVQAAHVIL
jgi:hypothetical protein